MDNILNPDLYVRLDCDLRRLWRIAGYKVPSLRCDMKALFRELEEDAVRYAEDARESVLNDVMNLLFPNN